MSDELEKRIERIEETLATLISWQYGIVLDVDAVKALLDMLMGTKEDKPHE